MMMMMMTMMMMMMVVAMVIFSLSFHGFRTIAFWSEIAIATLRTEGWRDDGGEGGEF